jgi:hypothetical protein
MRKRVRISNRCPLKPGYEDLSERRCLAPLTNQNKRACGTNQSQRRPVSCTSPSEGRWFRTRKSIQRSNNRDKKPSVNRRKTGGLHARANRKTCGSSLTTANQKACGTLATANQKAEDAPSAGGGQITIGQKKRTRNQSEKIWVQR